MTPVSVAEERWFTASAVPRSRLRVSGAEGCDRSALPERQICSGPRSKTVGRRAATRGARPTHNVALANKVQTVDGQWLSIDGRVLHAAKVGVPET